MLEARALGFAPSSVRGITLHVGDRLTRDLSLTETARRLDDIVVRGAALRDAGAGGPAYSIPGEAVRNLPLLNRDFVSLFGMAAQATGATNISISGQHFKFNGIQVDGGTSGDFFGTNVTSGANSGGKAISLEALEEIRVLVAPFDVRQGGFSGGLINAVTRSGTNEPHGSAFISLARPELVGRDTAGAAAADFNTLQYGASMGGPLIRDRLHYFLVADLQSQRTPYVGPSTGDAATGVSDSTARRAARVFRDRYGFDAGGPDAPVLQQPDQNIFLKLSWHASPSHTLALTQTIVGARKDAFDRVSRNNVSRDGWELSKSGSALRNRTLTTRLTATSAFGVISNEAVVSFGTVDDALESANRVPLFLVSADLPNTYLAGGSVKGAQDTETRQRVLELTDDVSWTTGNHVVTAGTQDQLLAFRDNFFLGSWGTWTFASVDSLERGQPMRYDIAIPNRPGGPIADYSSLQLAGYLQDRWIATERLTLTAGVRYDVPFLDAPTRNPALAGNAALGHIDTGVFPSGNGVFSPRLGFAYLVGSGRQTMLRGGVGGFAGKPPYAWLTAAFVNTGQEQSQLVCSATDGVPPTTTDIGRVPTRCLNAAPASTNVPSITTFDRSYRFQQAIKYSLGVDQDLGAGLTLSFDAIHTRTANTTFVRDMNLIEHPASAEGRAMYGVIASPLAITPSRVDFGYGAVYRFENRTADRSTAVTAVLDKHWSTGGLLEIGYNWSRTDDLMSLSGILGPTIINGNPLDGTMQERRLARSARDIPHNLVITGIAPRALGVTSAMFFRARSGTPYAYTTNGDVNADGSATNDLMYVPRNASDLSLVNSGAFPALNAFIESEGCLREQRGRVMARNTCRNPSVWRLDARVARPVSLGGGRTLEITADVFNLPNLLDHRWGVQRQTTSSEAVPLLVLSGWDAAANRPRYTIPAVLPPRNAAVVDASRWQMQIGARLSY
jgi:hypothetical protein